MKTYNNFYSEVISLPNLYRAYEKAKKGKTKKKEVIEFSKNLHENLLELHLELLNKTYAIGEYKTFFVTDYKKRKITAPRFKDMVVQHALFNFLEPIYESVFIFDSYACRKEKGTHKGFKRLKSFINKSSYNDYFIKHELKVKYYVRYVDDFVFIVKDKNQILEFILKIKEFLKKELYLKLENRKIQINKISFGVDFAGYVGFKRYTRIRSRNYRRFIKKFREKAFLLKKDKLSYLKFYSSFISYLGHLKITNSNKIKMKIIYFYLYAITFAGELGRAVKRGGNWNNGADAGLFSANLNNAPSNTNTNIGFRCCSEPQIDAMFLRKHSQLEIQKLLQLSEGNNFQIKTGAGIQQLFGAVILAMKNNEINNVEDKEEKKEIQKVYKPLNVNSNNMLPGDPKGSPDESFFSGETLIFIDANFLSKLSKHFGKGNYLIYDLIKFSSYLTRKQKLNCKKIFYYTAPPFQSPTPTKEEENKKDGYDRFVKKLRDKGVIVREGRCQRLKIDGKFSYSQKAVDVFLAMDLTNVPIKYPNVKRIILISTDSDFVPVIQNLKENGVKTVLYTYYEKIRDTPFSRSNHLIKSVYKYVLLRKDLLLTLSVMAQGNDGSSNETLQAELDNLTAYLFTKYKEDKKCIE